MKKLSVLFLFFIPLSLFASHYMGGEISWECLQNGRYRFIMKLYRECNGITYSSTETISVTNCPTLSAITMRLCPGANPRDGDDGTADGKTDISPDCWNFSQEIRCMPSPSAPNTGAVEEWYYTSDTVYPAGVLINGVPPAQGWIFSYASCCRNACTNIINASSLSWVLRAIMYPYQGQNSYPCYDSSPAFAEAPATAICVGYPYTMINMAMDKESDPFVYDWDCPGPFAPGQYAPGYSCSHPLPGGILDTNSGDVIIDSFANGAFVYIIKITSFRNGIKTSEVFREFQVVLLACPGGVNNAPTMNASFYNPGTGLYDAWTDTINTGESEDADIVVQDADLLPNGNPNTVFLEAIGEYFGLGYTNTLNGCPFPPCATMNPALPLSGLVGVSTHFHWNTDCGQIGSWIEGNHEFHYSPPYFYFPFDFIIRAYDNYCPVPATTINRMKIVLREGPIVDNPSLICAETDSAGNVTLTWDPPADTGNDFHAYIIYRDTSLAGNFEAIDTLLNISQTSFTDPGINPDSSIYSYYISSFSGCSGWINRPDSGHAVSTSSMKLNIQNLYPFELEWVSSGILLPATPWYNIYVSCHGQAWELYDSTQQTAYIFNNMDSIYGDCYFQVMITDSFGCVKTSSMVYYYFAGLPEPVGRCHGIYPNPASERLTVKCDDIKSYGDIEIFDVYGRKYAMKYSENISRQEIVIDVSSLAPGIYYLKKPDCLEVEKILIIR